MLPRMRSWIYAIFTFLFGSLADRLLHVASELPLYNPVSIWRSSTSDTAGPSPLTMPLAPRPPYRLSAIQVRDLLRNNTLTVEEYARSLLGRIKERDDVVKAWIYLDPAYVLRQAQALDQVPHDQRGPLHGVAIAIKDVMNTKGTGHSAIHLGLCIAICHCSRVLMLQICPPSSALRCTKDTGRVLTHLRLPFYELPGPLSLVCLLTSLSGCTSSVISSNLEHPIGKTTTTEFTVTNSGGAGSGPETTNPHDPNRTPGGSSCGSAAAVADYQVPISLGAQTGGSIIRPASFTGVFALKPTHNSISPEGQKTFSPNFDTVGFFARTIEDLQLVADVFALKDDEPPQDIPLNQTTVAMIKTPMWDSAGPGTVAAMKHARAVLERSGVMVEEVSFPTEIGDLETLQKMQMALMYREAQVAFLREYRINKTSLAPEICRLVENSSNFTNREALRASDKYAGLRPVFDELAARYSAIITPSVIDEAPLGLENMGSAVFNTFWTGLHMPVINIPAFSGAHGMPIGLSFVAGRLRDQHLLHIGKALSGPLMAGGGWKTINDNNGSEADSEPVEIIGDQKSHPTDAIDNPLPSAVVVL
ncbi:amidase signature domain-containing protein, partial [Podospora appendiculata]